MTTKNTSLRLRKALRNRLLIKFTRPSCEAGWVLGYVLDIGARFFLVARVSDNLWFDGFSCFRISDVRQLEAPSKYAAFEEAALQKRGERCPARPRVQITGMEQVLVSASAGFPMVVVHRERIDPDVCHVGRVLGIARGRLGLLEICPDATWEDQPTEYRVREITRVDFGGDYEEALYLVGGAPGFAQTTQQPVRRRRG